uniref:40S ribosomal protein S30 n=1 Tax=Tetrahymena pyriformis TaxID=5908 RepID=D6NT86_TETPY|nr:ribosomal protein S30 [Tetrahymena pyriformis]
MGRMHGTLAKAGKVRKQTPKVEKKVAARKIPKGRAYKRILYNRRYAPHILAVDPKKRKSPNWHAGKKEKIDAAANPVKA